MTAGPTPIGGASPPEHPPTIALLLNNPFVTDSRVWKMSRALTAAGYRVMVVARTGDGLPARESVDGVDVVRLGQPTPLRWLPAPRLPPGEDAPMRRAARGRGMPGRTRAALTASVGRAVQALRYVLMTRAWAAAIREAVPRAAVWQAEGLVTLPVALRLRAIAGGSAVYDARDLDVQSARFARLPKVWRRLLERRERSWIRAVDGMLSVSEPYASVIRRTTGRDPTIVMNGTPDFTPPEPPERRFHDALDLPERTPVVLYLGLVMDGRGIEQLTEAIGLVPGAVLVVAGFGADYERYRRAAEALPHRDRIRFMPGIPPAEILSWVASADISAMPVQGDTLNHRLNTPTKLFDAMGAGVPVVASDLPGMAPIVRSTGCGVLCDPEDPADIARAIREILDAPPERRAEFRSAALRAARGEYSWERQVPVLLDFYRRLGVTGAIGEEPR